MKLRTWFAAAVALFLAGAAVAQPASWPTDRRPSTPADGTTGFNKSLGYMESYSASANAWSPVLQGPVNTNNPSGYQLGGATILNTLANTGSPILSPETQNAPLASSLYSGAPITQGYASTWSATSGNGVYSQMFTANLTLSGSPSVHWGAKEDTLFATGNGVTMTGELNVNKTVLWIDTGLTVTSSSEAFEPSVQNFGTTSGGGVLAGLRSNLANMASGTISNTLTAYDIGWSNANTTAASIFQFQGITCEKMTGAGAAPANGRAFCIYNVDPTQEIATFGHVALRTPATLPVASACGTGCALNANSSDMQGTVTEGTNATGFVLTFAIQYAFAAPFCQVTSPNGAVLTSFSVTQSALTVVNPSASGNQYSYVCFSTR